MAVSPDSFRRIIESTRALLGSALFVCLAGAQAAEPRCAPDRIDEQVRVGHVHDGDTVVLVDGRKVRLIGINTPELGRKQAPAEAYAVAARTALHTLLAQEGFRIGLRHGAERYDRYSRALAHLFTSDGRNVQAVLLQQGLAAPIVFPPNIWQHECYRVTAERAREMGLGIWSLPRYQGLSPAELRGVGGGFYAVRGRVHSVKRSRRSVWLNMGYDFALRIAKEDLLQFPDLTPESLRARTVRATGWVSARGDRSMRLRHATQLEVLE